MIKQYFCGAALEAVRHALRGEKGLRVSSALRRLSVAEVKVSGEGTPIDHSFYAVADNLLSRGLPTLASLRVERALSEALKLTREAVEDGSSIRFPLIDDLSENAAEWLLRSVVTVDPRASRRLAMAEPALESEAERTFFEQVLPELVGPWAQQLVEAQRAIETILRDDCVEFADQRVDFSVELSPHSYCPASLVVEIDGRQHREPRQRYLDEKRDKAFEKAGWGTVRIEARHGAQPSPSVAEAIRQFFDHPDAARAAANWGTPLWKSSQGLRWMQAVLTPFVVARVQKVLVRFVLEGLLDPEADVWRLAVVERDVPGARLAVEDLQEFLQQLGACWTNGIDSGVLL